jgi:HKD family nuclease
MKALLYESEVKDTFLKELKSAKRITMAEALITVSGFDLIIEQFLERGGAGQVLIGFDLATHPDAVDALLKLQELYPKRWEVCRFESPSKTIFHPKFILFHSQQGKQTAILGSANLTGGGWGRNHEANAFLTENAIINGLKNYFEELFIGAYAHKITERWMLDYRKIWIKRLHLRLKEDAIRREVRNINWQRKEGPSRIKGHRFCFTGKIWHYPRRKLYPDVKKLKGVVVTQARSIHTADCLVHAEVLGQSGTTKKLKRARKLKIPIMAEDRFLKLMDKERKLRRK